jgi:adenylate cyclase
MGMAEYFERNFTVAAGYFRDALKVMPGDDAASMLLERARKYIKSPPPDEWGGVEVMTLK